MLNPARLHPHASQMGGGEILRMASELPSSDMQLRAVQDNGNGNGSLRLNILHGEILRISFSGCHIPHARLFRPRPEASLMPDIEVSRSFATHPFLKLPPDRLSGALFEAFVSRNARITPSSTTQKSLPDNRHSDPKNL